MLKLNHTPGPWRNESYGTPVFGSDGSLVAAGIGIRAASEHVCTVYSKNADANARLIAAAPELLEALKCLRDAFKHKDYWENVADIVIAKAESEIP